MASLAESKASGGSAVTLTVAGYASCADFQKAANVVAALEHLEPSKCMARILEFDSKAEYDKWLPTQKVSARSAFFQSVRGPPRGGPASCSLPSPYLARSPCLAGMRLPKSWFGVVEFVRG